MAVVLAASRPRLRPRALRRSSQSPGTARGAGDRVTGGAPLPRILRLLIELSVAAGRPEART
jgi:hypothetical protein